MSTNKTDRDNWRKFLGIKEPSTALESGRVGGSIGRTAGRSGGGGGGGELDSDSVPDGEEEEGAEKGDGAGDAGEQIKVGDELDRLEDLYDCETGEEVTIDGLGEKGSENYPTGFNEEICKQAKPCDFQPDTWVVRMIINETQIAYFGQTEATVCSKAGGSLNWIGICVGKAPSGNDFAAGFTWLRYGDLTPDQQNLVCDIRWPAPDKNHLVWNEEKKCMEPLCPELNNQVADKYKSCNDEMILCDEDGNKVKVEIDGDTVKVTQAKYNQTAEIKDGKVQTVKKLSESQTEAEFK